jgi:short-subunit dehydrogenase
MDLSKKAIVVGASSGIGAALSEALAGRGYSVALVARREELLTELADKINKIAGRDLASVYTNDVTDYDSAAPLFMKIAADMGGVDLIAYSSGVMPIVGPDEFSTSKDRSIIEVNVIGAMAWLNVGADMFALKKSGTIIGISSVAADRGRRPSPAYNASKAALDTYLEALRNRLTRYGVHVLTIKPGPVLTDMIKGTKLPPVLKPITAQDAASQILDALDSKAQVRYVPGVWRWVGLILKHLPSPIMRKLSF